MGIHIYSLSIYQSAKKFEVSSRMTFGFSVCIRLLGLTDFYDEVKTLPMGDAGEQPTAFTNGDNGMGKLKKRKVS